MDNRFLLILILCYIIEKVYFFIAERMNIVDRPNHRTLHVGATIRGGGIVFPVSVMLYFVFFGAFDWYFFAGLVIVSVMSFIDDLGHIKSSVRLLGQFLAIGLVAWQLGYWDAGWIWWILMMVISVGVLNAYNFMDGINGITGGYSFVLTGSLMFINTEIIEFTDNAILLSVVIGLLVFNFFNFRIKATCFAGDVGSVSIAFINVYFVLKLIMVTNNLLFILLLAVYGVDTVLTIIHRLIRKENIFEAHRLHLFQVIVKNKKIPHLVMSGIYMLVQLIINGLIFFVIQMKTGIQMVFASAIILILAGIYIFVKSTLMIDKK